MVKMDTELLTVIKLKNKEKKNEKVEKYVEEEKNDVQYLPTSEKEKEKEKEIRFVENIKELIEAGMLCTIKGETFCPFMKNM